MGLTESGLLTDYAVKEYNQSCKKSKSSLRASRRAFHVPPSIEQEWDILRSLPPGLPHFPPFAPGDYMSIFELTRIAQWKSATIPDPNYEHTRGCVCQFLPVDCTQITCHWCRKSHFPSRGHLCNHISSREHRMNCSQAAGRCEYEVAKSIGKELFLNYVGQMTDNIINMSPGNPYDDISAIPSCALSAEATPSDSGDWQWHQWNNPSDPVHGFDITPYQAMSTQEQYMPESILNGSEA